MMSDHPHLNFKEFELDLHVCLHMCRSAATGDRVYAKMGIVYGDARVKSYLEKCVFPVSASRVIASYNCPTADGCREYFEFTDMPSFEAHMTYSWMNTGRDNRALMPVIQKAMVRYGAQFTPANNADKLISREQFMNETASGCTLVQSVAQDSCCNAGHWDPTYDTLERCAL